MIGCLEQCIGIVGREKDANNEREKAKDSCKIKQMEKLWENEKEDKTTFRIQMEKVKVRLLGNEEHLKVICEM